MYITPEQRTNQIGNTYLSIKLKKETLLSDNISYTVISSTKSEAIITDDTDNSTIKVYYNELIPQHDKYLLRLYSKELLLNSTISKLYQKHYGITN